MTEENVMSELLMDEQNMDETIVNERKLNREHNSGFDEFDDAIAGFQKGNIYVLMGRPSMGKTTFAINMVREVALKQNKPVLYISLGQSAEMVTTILGDKTKSIKKTSLEIDDSLSASVETVREKLTGKYHNAGIELIVIDYLQLMSAGEVCQSKQEEISKILRELKTIAKEFDLSILVLFQLGRLPEERSENRPMLSELKESSAIVEDANCVFFIYRVEDCGYDSGYKGIVEIIIAKNDFGPLKTIRFHYSPEKGRFEEI